jgi:hypothetical protein
MKPIVIVMGAMLAMASAAITHGQAKTDFSGKWTYDQAKSGRGTAGNAPQVSFPTDLVIKHTLTEVDLETSTSRQDVIKMVCKLDGSEIAVPGPAGITLKAKARMDGDKLVIESKRSFTSPAGEITNEFKEVYTLTGGSLTVEKTVTTGGVESTAKAVYNKIAAS